MNGHAIPYTPIAVDFWKTRQCPRIKYFFLTHAYVDQSCGLSHSWSMPIYCSPVTRNILLSKFSIRPEFVHGLELDVLHSISLADGSEDCIKVTLMDSNYCPGSVMFFFEGYFGRILYTGNFRFNEIMQIRSSLSNLLRNPVDVLYLDNTYCNLKCTFPTKESSLHVIKGIIENHKDKKTLIALKPFGKEELLISLTNHFKEKIRVGEDRLKVLEILKEERNFTTNNFVSTNIEVLPFCDIFHKAKHDLHSAESSICLVPTGLFTALGYNPFEKQTNVFLVPYSNHSSYPELIRFVSFVHPKSVVPIYKPVSDPLSGALMDRTNIDCFQEFLDRSPMHHYHIPQSVLKVMNQSSAPKSKRLSKTSIKKASRKRSEPALGKSEFFENGDGEKRSSAGREAFLPKHLPSADSKACCTKSVPSHRVSLTVPPATRVLKRCKSLDSLTSLPEQDTRNECHQINMIDLNSSIANINFYQSSNLVRCHRARLCIPGLCQTVCHSKSALKCNCQNCCPLETISIRGFPFKDANHANDLANDGKALPINHRKLSNVSNPMKLISDKTESNMAASNVNDDNRHLNMSDRSPNSLFSNHFNESPHQKLANADGEEYEPSRKVMKQSNDKNNDNAANELPPKKKWCNMFNTSQLSRKISPETEAKPKPATIAPQRRLGTTANPVDACLNSIAKVSAVCQISDSGHRNISNVIYPRPAAFMKPATQLRCGSQLITGFHFIPKIMTDDLLNFVQPSSPMDLSISKT